MEPNPFNISGGFVQHMVTVVLTANQSIANGFQGNIVWDAAPNNNFGMWNKSTPATVRLPKDGIYSLSYSGQWNNESSLGTRFSRLIIYNTQNTIIKTQIATPSVALPAGSTWNAVLVYRLRKDFLVANEVYQDSGSTLTLLPFEDERTSMSIVRLGD